MGSLFCRFITIANNMGHLTNTFELERLRRAFFVARSRFVNVLQLKQQMNRQFSTRSNSIAQNVTINDGDRHENQIDHCASRHLISFGRRIRWQSHAKTNSFDQNTKYNRHIQVSSLAVKGPSFGRRLQGVPLR
jgi:hypothetical protein